MHLQIFGTLLSAVVLVSGCSKEDKAAETTGAFLSMADFSASGATKLSADDAVALLSKSDWIRDEESEDDSDDDNAISKCSSENTPKVEVINKSTMSVVGDVDATACIKAAGNGAEIPFSKFTMKFAVNLSCDGADFTSLSGKSFSDIELDSVADEKCGTNVRKAFLNGNIELGIGDKTLFIKTAIFGKDGGACQSSKSDGKELLSDCILAESSNFASLFSESEVNELVVLTAENLLDSGSSGATWYEAGKYSVVVNNFTGSVTYKGATTAPEYTLTDGAETKSGTLSSESAFRGFLQSQSLANGNLIKGVFKRLTRLH